MIPNHRNFDYWYIFLRIVINSISNTHLLMVISENTEWATFFGKNLNPHWVSVTENLNNFL